MKSAGSSTILFAYLLLMLSSRASAQSVVTSSYSPDYHFKLNDTSFFPIGWYNVQRKADLLTLKKSGANIVLTYWNGIWEKYGHPKPKPYTRDEYLFSLRSFLRAADSAGLKAIVDLGATANGDFGFSGSGIARLVDSVAAYPAVFAWYLYDEPYFNLWYTSCNAWPTRDYLQEVADTVRSVERRLFGRQRHPLLPVIADPRFFADYNSGGIDTCKSGKAVRLPPPFYPASYDAIGWDDYPYTRAMDTNTHWWRDFNDVSRLVARRAMEQTRKLRKMAFLFVAQGADASAGTDLRSLTSNEILYESISPVIQGARGLLYWWWREEDSSPQTRSAINNFIRFFTHEKLDKVLMNGQNCDARLALGSFSYNDTPAVSKAYVWKNHNNLHRVIMDTSDAGTLSFRLFNYVVRKYSGAYFILAVNDYRKTVRTNFILDGLVESNAGIRRIVELRPEGSREQQFERGARKNEGTVPVTFVGYGVHIFKIELSH